MSSAAYLAIRTRVVRVVYHLSVIRTKDRDGLQNHLAAAGIRTCIHYLTPVHLQEAYESLRYKKEDFPVAATVASEILLLPMYPGISVAEQRRVAEVASEFVKVQSAQRGSFDADRYNQSSS